MISYSHWGMIAVDDFRLEMEKLKDAFRGSFWVGSGVSEAIKLLADTVSGFDSRLKAIESISGDRPPS